MNSDFQEKNTYEYEKQDYMELGVKTTRFWEDGIMESF